MRSRGPWGHMVRRLWAAGATVLFLAVGSVAVPTAAVAADECTAAGGTREPTGSPAQYRCIFDAAGTFTFPLPDGATEVSLIAEGSVGGGSGGRGATATAMNVPGLAGKTLTILAGTPGGLPEGGFPDGAPGGTRNVVARRIDANRGYGGGGSSSVFDGTTLLVKAGGGGGAGGMAGTVGGGAGGNAGTDVTGSVGAVFSATTVSTGGPGGSSPVSSSPEIGGTGGGLPTRVCGQTVGESEGIGSAGNAAGASTDPGAGGAGGLYIDGAGGGGGGGGGYAGGGGGATGAGTCTGVAGTGGGGAGGGSSYVVPTSLGSIQQGPNAPNGGSGVVTVLYVLADTPTPKLPQTISFPVPDAGLLQYGLAPVALTATADSGLAVSYAVTSGTANCSVTGTTLTLLAAGPCQVTASQDGDPFYNPAQSVSRSLSISKAGQTISFGALADRTFGTADFTVSASATSGLPVSFSASGSCTVSGATAHLTGAGPCTVTAAQAGNADFAAAPEVVRSFAVGRQDQTISFAPPARAVRGDSYVPQATATSALPVSFSIDPASTPGACSYSSGKVTFTGPGNCVVVANQAGDSDHKTAQTVTGTIAVTDAFLGFLSPLPKTKLVKSNTTIPVKFTVGNRAGTTKSSSAVVEVRLTTGMDGGGTVLGSQACAYSLVALAYQCNLKSPAPVQTNTTPYYLTVFQRVPNASEGWYEMPTGTGVKNGNSEVVYFK